MSIKVLILEDEVTIRENLAAFLEDEGMDVIQAENAELALELLSNHSPDLAVVDIRLSGMDGNQWIIKAHLVCPKMKFLIYTGVVDYRLNDALKEIGLSEQDVLFKPLPNMAIITEAIEQKIKSA